MSWRLPRPVLWRARRIEQFRAILWGRLRLPARAMNVATLGKLDMPDVCILGSGPAGAVLGLDLAERGWKVLIVESASGQRFAGRRPDLQSAGEVDYPVAASRFLGFGGTSVLWYGACPRLRPIDFQRNAYTPPDAAWPIGYADLEPYYDRAEQSLGVRGGAAGSAAAPGFVALPRAGGSADQWLHRADLDVEPARVARAPAGSDCFRVARDLLPRYCEEGGHAMLGIGTATGLEHDGDGRVISVVLRDRYGRSAQLRAKIYVVACGGLETPRLLLASRSASFPDGMGNHSGLVGRFFMEHLKLRFRGTVQRGVSARGRSFQYYEEFKQRGLGSPILSIQPQHPGRPQVISIAADIEMLPSRENRVMLADERPGRPGKAGANLALRLSARDLDTVRAVSALVQRIYRRLGANEVVSVPGHYGIISWLYHHLGTCRMGRDPANSVIDANLRVHGSPNLYLAGSAPFVTGGGSNPTLTIAALSHRLADHLHERLAGSA